MGVIDEMVRLQNGYKGVADEWRTHNREFQALEARLGNKTQLQAQYDELTRQIAEPSIVEPEEHGEFPSDHDVEYLGDGRVRWKNIAGCPDCDRIMVRHGKEMLKEERKELIRQSEALKDAWLRRHDAFERAKSHIDELNRLGHTLGLPSFEAGLDRSGFMTSVGKVNNFTPHGQLVLERGRFVDYKIGNKVARAIFDEPERLVAYHLGDSKWVLARSGSHSRTREVGWKERVVGAAAAVQVVGNVISGSSDTNQLADYQQLQNEQRMEQGLEDSTRQSSYESDRSEEHRDK